MPELEKEVRVRLEQSRKHNKAVLDEILALGSAKRRQPTTKKGTDDSRGEHVGRKATRKCR